MYMFDRQDRGCLGVQHGQAETGAVRVGGGQAAERYEGAVGNLHGRIDVEVIAHARVPLQAPAVDHARQGKGFRAPTSRRPPWRSLLAALWLISPALSAEPVVRVGLGTDKPPYIFENQARGLEYEVVTGALTAAGLDFRVQHAPPERLERMFLARQIDALTTVTARSNPDAHLSAPYLRYRNMAVALAVRQLRLETIADLQHYSISAFQRARLLLGEEYYQMTLRNPRYREEARQIARNRLLYSGRVEVAVGGSADLRLPQRAGCRTGRHQPAADLVSAVPAHRLPDGFPGCRNPRPLRCRPRPAAGQRRIPAHPRPLQGRRPRGMIRCPTWSIADMS